MWEDVRYALRQLWRAPGFAIPAVVTLALGIGANTAIFSAAYAVLLRSLPLRDADRVMSVLETHPQVAGGVEATYPDYLDWRAQQKSFEQIAAYSTLNPDTVSMVVAGHAEQVHRVLASGDFFSVLGVRAGLGRLLGEQDDRTEAAPVVVLSAGAWRRYLGGDPGVIGRGVTLNGASYSVIGVLPEGASYPSDGDVWLPLARMDAETRASRVWHSVRVIGRLLPGVEAAQAGVDMRTVAARLAAEYPATNRLEQAVVSPLREQLVGSLRPALLSLAGCAGLVFLIAFANVGNLLLMWAARGRREAAIRQALGAGRVRLFRQSLMSTLVLCLSGCVLGVGLAGMAVPLLRRMLGHTAGADAVLTDAIGLNVPVLLFALGVSTLAALGLSLLAVARVGARLADVLSSGGRGNTRAAGRQRLALIVGQVALAVVVVFLSALFVRSFTRLTEVDPGFRTDHLLSAELTLPEPRYEEGSPQTARFYERVLEGIAASPGVISAGSTTQLPLMPSQVMTRFLVAGAAAPEAGRYPFAQMRFVSPGFFGTLGLGLVAGRLVDRSDVDQQRNVMVVNRAFVRKYLGGGDALSQSILLGVMGAHPVKYPIVGVVTDGRDLGVATEAEPEIYLAGFGLHAVLLVRTAGDPEMTIGALKNAVHGVDPEQPIYNVQTLDAVRLGSLTRQRMTTALLAVFAGMALGLAAIGIYGALAYSVTQRRREIGVRMAVGAARADIVRHFLGQAMGVTAAGVVLGLGGALAAGKLLRSQLFETSVWNPMIAGFVVLTLVLVGVVAAALPALRAASTDPVEVLRAE